MIETLTIPYARVDGGTLDLHVTRPYGARGCPALLDIHGGAWTFFDHRVDFYWCRELAKRGYVTASADFRLAPQHPWPLFLSDLRAASRWLRAHAAEIGADPGRIGAIGGSTGGHLSTLLGLWPSEPAHPATAALGVADDADAHLDFVVALWPILDVLGRYRMVKEFRFGRLTTKLRDRILARNPDGGQPSSSSTVARMRRLDELRTRSRSRGDFVTGVVQRVTAIAGELPLARALLYATLARAHDGAFRDIAQMEGASPLHIVRRGAAQQTPPMLVVQGDRDTNMTIAMTVEFSLAYRHAGGTIDVQIVPGMGHSFGNIPSRAADDLVDRVDRFVRSVGAGS